MAVKIHNGGKKKPSMPVTNIKINFMILESIIRKFHSIQ